MLFKKDVRVQIRNQEEQLKRILILIVEVPMSKSNKI